MKTFLGITTGFLAGTFVGISLMASLQVLSPEFREYIEKVANDI